MRAAAIAADKVAARRNRQFPVAGGAVAVANDAGEPAHRVVRWAPGSGDWFLPNGYGKPPRTDYPVARVVESLVAQSRPSRRRFRATDTCHPSPPRLPEKFSGAQYDCRLPMPIACCAESLGHRFGQSCCLAGGNAGQAEGCCPKCVATPPALWIYTTNGRSQKNRCKKTWLDRARRSQVSLAKDAYDLRKNLQEVSRLRRHILPRTHCRKAKRTLRDRNILRNGFSCSCQGSERTSSHRPRRCAPVRAIGKAPLWPAAQCGEQHKSCALEKRFGNCRRGG